MGTNKCQILIATQNPGKVREFREMLKTYVGPTVEVVSLPELGIQDEPDETGETFSQNAIIKAQYYFEKTGIPALADDGGIEINALGGEPGIRSRRWVGDDATDQELVDYTLERMNDIPSDKRQAKFTVALCFYPTPGQEIIVTKCTHGHIKTSPAKKVESGFPYRAIFAVKPYDKLYDELSPQEHEESNHRQKAIQALLPTLQKWHAQNTAESVL